MGFRGRREVNGGSPCVRASGARCRCPIVKAANTASECSRKRTGGGHRGQYPSCQRDHFRRSGGRSLDERHGSLRQPIPSMRCSFAPGTATTTTIWIRAAVEEIWAQLTPTMQMWSRWSPFVHTFRFWTSSPERHSERLDGPRLGYPPPEHRYASGRDRRERRHDLTRARAPTDVSRASEAAFLACAHHDAKISARDSPPGVTTWAANTRLGTVRLTRGTSTVPNWFEAALESDPEHAEATIGLMECRLWNSDGARPRAPDALHGSQHRGCLDAGRGGGGDGSPRTRCCS